jgi:hypothetical protein
MPALLRGPDWLFFVCCFRRSVGPNGLISASERFADLISLALDVSQG